MNEDRNPALEKLFEIAALALAADEFVADVMRRINAMRRRSLAITAGMAMILLSVASLLAAPLLEAVHVATAILPTPLVDIDELWVRQLLSPVNSIAATIALGVLLLRWAWRKLSG